MDELNWPLMLGAGIIASASPGPATLGIAGTSMRHGRRAGLSLSAGIMAGSYIWSATAAFGVGAILLAHVWMLETVRYCGGAYLLWLAFKSLRSAMVPGAGKIADMPAPRGHFMAGLALHITNPKPIVLWHAVLHRRAGRHQRRRTGACGHHHRIEQRRCLLHLCLPVLQRDHGESLCAGKALVRGCVRSPFRARRRANSDHAPDAVTESARGGATDG